MNPQSQAKERVKRIKENPKELRVRTKVPKAHAKGQALDELGQVDN